MDSSSNMASNPASSSGRQESGSSTRGQHGQQASSRQSGSYYGKSKSHHSRSDQYYDGDGSYQGPDARGRRDYSSYDPSDYRNGYVQGNEYFSRSQRPYGSSYQNGSKSRRYGKTDGTQAGYQESQPGGSRERSDYRKNFNQQYEHSEPRYWYRDGGTPVRDSGGSSRGSYQDNGYGQQDHHYHHHQKSTRKSYNKQKYESKKQSTPESVESLSEQMSELASASSVAVNQEGTLSGAESTGNTDQAGSERRNLPSQSYYQSSKMDNSQRRNQQRQSYSDRYAYGYEKRPAKQYQSKTSFSSKAIPPAEVVETGSSLPVDVVSSSEPLPKKELPKKKQNPEKQTYRMKSADFDQREKLIEQLSSGRYECMVCCDNVKQAQAIWSCSSCFNVFHIGCIKKWASTAASQGEEGWRCPACQTVKSKLPSGYFCFCGKVREPQWNYRDVPHSCGDLCLKPLGKDGDSICDHKCNILCHPGPCPPCTAQVQRTCPCGKTTKTVKCNTELDSDFCTMKCSKLLNCGKHECPALCHFGDCQECEVTYEIACYCQKETQVVPCSSNVDKNTRFVCELTCGKTLSCGNHKCELKCHPGRCMECPFLPDVVTTCPCGQTSLEKLYEVEGLKPRTSCKDLILTCGKVCSKELECGQPEKRHTCEADCHTGPCPVCPKTTDVRCRCGRNEIEIPCKDYKKDGLVLCERKCNKKRHCGRHKCLQTCCIDVDHVCTVVCGRLLSCGNHTCEELCHNGPCKRCLRASFEEMTCHCGAAVAFPPIACGTRPPECTQLCTRPRNCPHPPNHNCHSDPNCPPCTALTERWCFGRHEQRKNVLCHLDGISCGRPCGKPLPCGRHTCIRTCHGGECSTVDQKCVQPCPMPRPACGHPCGSPCHEGDCPEMPCRKKVDVSCECGHRKAVVSCEDQQSAYRKIAAEHLFNKMSEMNAGQSISLDSVLGTGKLDKSKSLNCDEECAKIERNRRLALALQIRNPDLLPRPGPPNYSQFMKDWVRKDSKFVQMVHEKLTDLVQLAKQSKQKSRQYSFPVMNREKRQFVHEYCEFFGCESQAFDEEPNRNVVATAFGDKSWLPAQTLFDVWMRENGQRKIPMPLGSSMSKKPPTSGKAQASTQQVPAAAATSSGFSYAKLSDVVKGEPKSTVIDYFDMTE